MNKFLVIFALFIGTQANADVYGYDQWMPSMVKNYLLDVSNNTPFRDKGGCESMYNPMLKDGVLDIVYAFGYFDDSTGEEHKSGDTNYGYSPSLDISAFKAMRYALIGSCTGRASRLCGFSERGDINSGKIVFEKKVKINGEKVLVRITMTYASASESFAKNKGELAGRQKMMTEQSEANYFGGLKTADVVFYNGHSRNGGGPDFNPPVLNSHMKTDYDNYYEPRRTGIKHVLANIPSNPNPGFVLGLFSCYSRKHFYDNFMSTNPKQRLILSADTIDYFDTMNASAGYLEGMLHGLCGQQLSDIAKQTAKLKTGFQAWNF
ncbi:MAG: hypothetical protein H7326_00910 [Bdellovibrionaceae bacterium]|nr:hypothetical protein [Pseudobdellovibrionaceae bacterium]